MIFASINLQLPIDRPAQAIMRNHSANRAFNEQFRMAHPPSTNVFRLMPADITGKAHKRLLLLLLSGNAHLVGIDHNNEITGINVRREDSFLFSTQQNRGFDSVTAEHLIFRVDQPPFPWNFLCFG